MSEATNRHQAAIEYQARNPLARVAMAVGLLAVMALLVVGASSVQGASGGIETTSGDGGGNKWDRLWDDFRAKERRWARRTSACESGNDPNIHGGGGTYHGAFQFMKSTWASSPKSPGGDPHTYRWKAQAVVAVYLKRRDGAGHWPVCG